METSLRYQGQQIRDEETSIIEKKVQASKTLPAKKNSEPKTGTKEKKQKKVIRRFFSNLSLETEVKKKKDTMSRCDSIPMVENLQDSVSPTSETQPKKKLTNFLSSEFKSKRSSPEKNLQKNKKRSLWDIEKWVISTCSSPRTFLTEN